MRTNDGWRVGFQLAPDHLPPHWPDPARPQQAHLDLRVPDLEPAAAAPSAGRHPAAPQRALVHLADPAGHPFDLCQPSDGTESTLLGVMLDCPDARR